MMSFIPNTIDIEKEIRAYLEFNPDVFKNKTVLLPCDDPKWSNFTKFFAQNFEAFGLKKLISTSYAFESKKVKIPYRPSLFETTSPQFKPSTDKIKGKIFTLDHDTNKNGKIDIDDLEWKYLKGDGDFRSDEVKKLRDEADITITNPPFSLFREFLAWIMEADKKFAIIGNKNCVTYKEVFPLIKDNEMWLGATNFNKGMFFKVPDDFVYRDSYKFPKELNGEKVNRVPGVCWFTNIEHGRRHKPLQLMTMADNIKYSKHKEIRGIGYQKYDNYNAIDVPYTDAIPSDYFEDMSFSFLNKEDINANITPPPPRWESLSVSSTNIAPSNLKSSGLTDMSMTIQTSGTDLQSTDVKPMRASSSNTKCSGVMGVPISFLDKYCPEQFEILGIDHDVKSGKLNFLINDSWNGKLDRGYLNNKRNYSRILIRFRKDFK